MLHLFQPRFRREIAAAAPDVLTALADVGALCLNMMHGVPDEMKGGDREGDEQFEMITSRRPVAEAAIARLVEAAGVAVRRGVAVTGVC